MSAAPSAPVLHPFSQSDVDAVVAEHVGELRQRCPLLPGSSLRSVELMFEIDPGGAVRDVAGAGGGAAERSLRACVEAEARSWKFRSPGKPTTIAASVPLVVD